MSEEPKKRNSKPVVTYILILFTAAFFIMAFSLVANQRSNDQTLDELRESISSLEEGQTTHDRVLTLQEEQSQLEQSLLILQAELEDAQEETEDWIETSQQLELQLSAMKLLFHLEESYRNGDLDTCSQCITYMVDTGADTALHAMDTPDYGNRYDALVSAFLEETN